jgi:PPOX class probable F420-dependent enzyme
MSLDISSLQPDVLEFLRDRHLAMLTTLRADGSPHVVPVGFTYEPETRRVRIITVDNTQKVRNAEHGNRAVVSQVDGGRWLSLEGVSSVSRRRDEVADAERRYAQRYRTPAERSDRVVIEIQVDRILGRV